MLASMGRRESIRLDWGSLIPTDRADRIKFFVVVGIVALTFLWLGYYLLVNVEWHKTAKAPTGPGWTASHEITEKLTADPAFADVGVSVTSPKPLKLAINGAVYSQEDLGKLVETMKQLRPEGDYEIHVEVLKR